MDKIRAIFKMLRGFISCPYLFVEVLNFNKMWLATLKNMHNEWSFLLLQISLQGREQHFYFFVNHQFNMSLLNSNALLSSRLNFYLALEIYNIKNCIAYSKHKNAQLRVVCLFYLFNNYCFPIMFEKCLKSILIVIFQQQSGKINNLFLFYQWNKTW